MKSVAILAAHFDPERDMFEIVKELTYDDGRTELNMHQFHAETLEWKAAEYGITDLDELISIILFEPFTEPVDVLNMGPDEARAKHKPTVLAQKAVLNKPVEKGKCRCDASKKLLGTLGVHQKYIDAVTDTPEDVIKQHAPFDAEVIAVRNAYLQQVRANNDKAKGESPVKVRPSGAVRATQERARLFRQENMRREGDRAGDRRGG